MRKMILVVMCLVVGIGLVTAPATAQEQTVTLHVAGMTCGACPISVRHRVLQMKGVHSANVDLETATATIAYEDREQNPEAIAQAITELGYPATIEEAKP